jgi:hypothetical protein
LRARRVAVSLRGDSMTALRWGREEKIKRVEAIYAAIVISTICLNLGIELNETDLISEKDN